MCSSLTLNPLSLEIMDISSYHRKSAQDKVKKRVGTPNFLTIARTS